MLNGGLASGEWEESVDCNLYPFLLRLTRVSGVHLIARDNCVVFS